MNINTLVLSGGSIKGIAYIGMLKYIEENISLFDIQECIGTSIGSFFALTIILGYTSDELRDIFFVYSLQKLQNIKITTFFEKFGLDDGAKLNKFIKSFIKNKGYDPEITLGELLSKTNKKLVTTTTNINQKKTVFIDAVSFPEIPVYLAVRMSMNLPFLYTPIEYRGELYIDGVSANLPVRYIIDKGDFEKILCIKFEEIIAEDFQIDSFDKYTIRILRTLLNTIECIDTQIATSKDMNILTIPIKTLNNFDFNISLDVKKEMYNIGYNAIHEYFLERIEGSQPSE